jgi:hypothetical protein
MSLQPPARVAQSTTTTGVGTYSLIAATGQYRNFNAAYASGAMVPFVATDNATGYEIGVGVLTTGSPDTLSRVEVFLSSNANNPVDWGAGAKAIFGFEVNLSAYLNVTTNATINHRGG